MGVLVIRALVDPYLGSILAPDFGETPICHVLYTIYHIILYDIYSLSLSLSLSLSMHTPY